MNHIFKRCPNVIWHERTKLSSKYEVFFVLWKISLTVLNDFKTNILSFFIAVQPKTKKIYSLRNYLNMLAQSSWGGVLESFQVIQLNGINLSSLVHFLREISVVHMASHWGHLELSRISFEFPREGNDRTWLVNSFLLNLASERNSLSNWSSDRWLFTDHHDCEEAFVFHDCLSVSVKLSHVMKKFCLSLELVF